ncbi:hypothetical protein AYO21_09596 [Fonsecaea monophora]|uniref:Uncharacterized protein n=1 Tax=Fonsecaea monophora TaxID=254056 RepID=A0A177EYT3_9EURO|nr:hypothetical protein AYO21_09596 [Fonsecaea monophora]OAG36202.1 hypothetical protein AYO21_09596 [Fonsecaea monophora]
MADAPNPLGPQPDFNVLSQHLIAAANEINKAQNLPAITGGERILVELQQMRQEFRLELQQMRQEFRQENRQMRQELRQELRQEIGQVRQEMRESTIAIRQDFATIMTASNHNNAARVQNAYLTDPANPLLPFVNPLTGAIIDGFPTVPKDIVRMNEQELDRVSQQLGIQAPVVTMSQAAKRRQLRVHIGLKAENA